MTTEDKARKKVVNDTDHRIAIDWVVREGAAPQTPPPLIPGTTVRASKETGKMELPPHTEGIMEYGNEEDIYLDGITVYATDDRTNTYAARVLKGHRGDEQDDLLNTHDTIIIVDLDDHGTPIVHAANTRPW